MKANEIAGKLDLITTQVNKISTEVQTLKDSLSNVDLPPEAQASLDRLTTAVNAVDEINPDAPTPTPTPPAV